MTDTLYDFAIVGGGPAGATLARMLAPKYRVALIDRKGPSQQKCCGGLLAPDAQKTMAAMGLGLPAEILDGSQLFGVRVVDVDGGVSAHYQRFYLNMNRGRFDDYLRSLIPGSVAVFPQSICVGGRLDGARWTVNCRRDGRDFAVQARYLVGADGGAGRVRGLLADNGQDRIYASHQKFFEEKHDEAVYTALFDSRISDFYHWVIPKEGYSIVGVTVPGGQSARKGMDCLLGTLKDLGMPYGRCLHEEGTILRRPRWLRGICLGDEKLFLLGEAAGLISPSSAEGISYALRSALCLGQVLLDCREDDWAGAYRRAVRGLERNILGKTLKLPAMYNPWLRRLAVRSGLMSLEIQSK